LKAKIGLEVHVQLTSLKTKLFCPCSSDYRGKEPNTNICPVCMGLPGTLPVLNGKAVREAVKIALALNSKVSRRMLFYRKNYFYPDMPKNFQITQYDKAGGVPLATGGYVEVNGKRIRIRRMQLEEDPGKITYEGTIVSSPVSLVDYNRAGIALVEIVTEPDMESPKEARLFLEKLRSILEHLGVCDCSLEGAMRCDANISIEGGRRVEVKNISSFKEVERALGFELTRQSTLSKGGLRVRRETRHWDEVRRITVSLRVKEEEEDYRYFPEPDLVPVEITDELIEDVKKEMPELPEERMRRLVEEYGISSRMAEVLTSKKALADFFEEAAKEGVGRRVASLLGEVLAYMNREGLEIQDLDLNPREFGALSKLVEEGRVSERMAKGIIRKALASKRPLMELVKGVKEQISDEDTIKMLVEEVVKENRKAVKDAMKNEKAKNFLMGEIMKRSRGRADPRLARLLLERKLEELKAEGF